jgi:cyclopropane fatty-acyl-phospholipid synthase-like methyltransferase
MESRPQAARNACAGHHLTVTVANGPLAEWRSRFLAATDVVGQLGFGPTFQRMWNLYLAYSEGGFRAGYLDVHPLLLEHS